MSYQSADEPAHQSDVVVEKRLRRIRMALAALGCLFVFAAFFGSMSRLDDMNLSAEERIAIFSWTDLRQRLYLGGALFAFLAAIVIWVWPRRRREK